MSWARVGHGVACALLVAGATLVACSPFGGGQFACTDSAQCGPDGTCEPNGLCSFPDATCTSGRRYGAAAGMLAGVCVGEEPPPDAPIGTPDAPDAPIGTPDAPPAAPFCDPADPTLRLCLAFEGNATDGSSYGNTPATTSVAFIAGQVGMAVATTDQSRIEVAEAASMDFDRFTFEAWIDPAQLPGSGRIGLADDNGEWGFFLYPGGVLRCSPVGGVMTGAVIAAQTWTHVACTYDGATIAIWIDGSVSASNATSGTIATGGTTGTSIAGDNPPPNDRFVGGMDQVRIFSEARSAAQLCAAAGRTSCP